MGGTGTGRGAGTGGLQLWRFRRGRHHGAEDRPPGGGVGGRAVHAPGGRGHRGGVRHLGGRVQGSALPGQGPAGLRQLYRPCAAGLLQRPDRLPCGERFCGGGRAGHRRKRHHHLERQPLPGGDHRQPAPLFRCAVHGRGCFRRVRQRVLCGADPAGGPVGDPGTGGQDERLGLPCRGGGRLPDCRRRTVSGLHRYRVRAGV